MADHQVLLKWYNSLYSRTVDLVGDYAGDERFILDGDSLLLHVFSDEKLDFYPGFQLLHATYMVEAFLHSLLRRKCNFHVAFFSNNAHLCIPQSAPNTLHSRYRLAREAIIQHLCHNLHRVVPSVGVRLFDGYQSLKFKDYLVSSGAYFFMCHDGALSVRANLNHAEGDLPDSNELSDGQHDRWGDENSMPVSELQSKLGFRCMIHWFICQSYNVALVNTLECRDTKIMAIILEDSAQRAQKLFSTKSPDFENIEDSQSLKEPKEEHTPRQETVSEALSGSKTQLAATEGHTRKNSQEVHLQNLAWNSSRKLLYLTLICRVAITLWQ
ncbi:DEAD DEAH box helicase [Aspergillus sclerotialis]|uniref:DEAD DEAH box helicase n=1 Tax=Aspergillus sclerotialis TaxID=2070753 RepID=A0A3A2ZMZ3_9EURO|nr:DEAD DEAH box helicase [Aspergillus sclerotialis]